ncbi:MAG: RNA polymerase sigma factor [Gemmatales bacterium]|nr:RNA polymerase sigma factor [Gemmatales bacterium]MDW7993371.1 RNA polymerase sigma factor [Gemmatales bacterium]
MQISDKLLLERIRQGDSEAWTQLVARYQGRLLASARRRLRDPNLAQDVVQETLLALHQAAPHLQHSWDLQTFLFSVLRNKIIDQLRKQGRHPLQQWADDPQLASVASGGAGPSTWFRHQERRDLEARTLAEVLQQLVSEWKGHGDYERLKVVELMFVKGWPNRQVAAFLKIDPQRVANIRFAVLERIRSLLRKRQLSPDVFPELQSADT